MHRWPGLLLLDRESSLDMNVLSQMYFLPIAPIISLYIFAENEVYVKCVYGRLAEMPMIGN